MSDPREELAELLYRATYGDHIVRWARANGPMKADARNQANAVLAAGYVSPDKLAELLAEARREGHRAGYETARGDLASGAFIGGPTYEALRDSFTGQRISAEAVAAAALAATPENGEEK